MELTQTQGTMTYKHLYILQEQKVCTLWQISWSNLEQMFYPKTGIIVPSFYNGLCLSKSFILWRNCADLSFKQMALIILLTTI